MTIKELLGKLQSNGLFGANKAENLDLERDVIVQVYEGEYEFDNGYTMPKYKYYEVRAVGMLFHEGEFKQVIAVGDTLDSPR